MDIAILDKNFPRLPSPPFELTIVHSKGGASPQWTLRRKWPLTLTLG